MTTGSRRGGRAIAKRLAPSREPFPRRLPLPVPAALALLCAFAAGLALVPGCGGGGGGVFSVSGDPAPGTASVVGGIVLAPASQVARAVSLAPSRAPEGYVPLAGATVALGVHSSSTDAGGRFRIDLPAGDPALASGAAELVVRSGRDSFPLRLAPESGRTTVAEIRVDLARRELIDVLVGDAAGLPDTIGVAPIADLVESRITSPDPAQSTLPPVVTGRVNVPGVAFFASETAIEPGLVPGRPGVRLDPAGADGWSAFRIEGLPPGLVELACRREGYAGAARTLDLRAGMTHSNAEFTITPLSALGELAIAVEEGAGQEAPVGEAVPRAAGFRVLDAAGLPARGVPVAFAVTAGGGELDAAELLPGIQDSGVTGADGRVWCDRWTLGQAPGPQELSATIATGRVRVASVSALARVGAPDGLAVAPLPAEVACGLPVPVAATVTDRFGNPVPGVPVGFAILASPVHAQAALFAPARVDTGADGTSAATLSVSGAIGRHDLRVFVSATLAVELSLLAVPGPPASVRFEPAGDLAVAADDPRIVLSVALADRFGNAVADGYEVELSVEDPLPANAGAAGAVAAGGASVSGRIEATLATSRVSGDDYRIAAAVKELPAVTGGSGTVRVGAAAAVRLTLAGASERVAGTPSPVTVTARDAFGNVAPAYAGVRTLRFTGPASSPDGVPPSSVDFSGRPVDLSADLALLFTSGVATAHLTLTRADAAFVLEATDGTVGTDTPQSRLPVTRVDPGPLARYRVAAPAEAGYKIPFAMTVTPVDAYGNPRTGSAAVVLTADGSDGTLARPSADTSAGPAAIPDQIHDRAATITIRASDGIVGDERSAATRVLPSAANAIDFPPDRTAQKAKTVRYRLGETASAATLTWRVVAGPGTGLEHVRALSGSELSAGAHELSLLAGDAPALLSGDVYELRLESVDLAGARRALETDHVALLYTTDLPAPPSPAALGHSNRTGKVAVLGSGAAAEDTKLRIYFDGALAGETEYLGAGGLSAGDTAFLGLPRQAPGVRIEYATVSRIAGYALGVESDRIADGTVPAPPDPAKLDWSAAFALARVRPSLRGVPNTTGRVRAYLAGPGAGVHTQANPLPDDAATGVPASAFTPAVAGVSTGTAVSWTFLDADDNESTLVADGQVPAPPTAAHLAEAAHGADNTRHHVNIASTPAPVARVSPAPGQPVHFRAHALLEDASSRRVVDGGAGTDNSGSGAPVDVTLPSVAAFDEGPLSVRAWVRDDDAGHDSPLFTGTQGVRDVTRPLLSRLAFRDTDEFADPDGLIDRVDLVFSEPVATGSGLSPDGSLVASLTLPDGQPADLSAALLSDPADASDTVVARDIRGQAVANTAAGALAVVLPQGAWRDRAGNRNAADAASGAASVDLASPLLLEVVSSAAPVSGRMLQDFLLQFVFSEPVRFGTNFDPDDLMNMFTDTPGAFWTDGTPDRFDDAPISLAIGPDGTAELHFRFDADSDPFGNWTPGVDDINLLDPQPADGFEDAAGNDARPAPSNVLIRWP